MDKPTPKLSRRTVFAGAGTAGALAAAAALLPKAPAEAPTATAAKPEVDDAKGGYQVTQHVLRYYQTTRI
ncbi:MAG: formate dehydrogenase [Piscinibacter sp.]